MRIPNIIFSVGTAALLFTASAGISFAKDEGRYVATAASTNVLIWITDTKTGRTKWCKPAGQNKPFCSPWAEADD
tara:strand:- start:1097 stop:1321 length:225 start_codon:yes stop_codon:yes gene_type:complete